MHLKLEDDGAPDFARYVAALLNATLPPDGPKSPTEAAGAVDALFNMEHAERKGASSFLWWFWDLYHASARQVPYGSPEQDRLWTSLPMFASTYGETVSDGGPHCPLSRLAAC